MSTLGTNVSCVLPVKNGADYLRDLIPAILGMLQFGDELIVINDGSTDETLEILEEFRQKEERIRLIQTEGIGLVSALNLGVDNASNPWIARFDVDDVFDPSRLSIQKLLISDSIAVIFSDYSFTTHSGCYLGTVRSAMSGPATQLSLISAQRTPHPVSLINRELFFAAGGYFGEDYPAEDLGLWLRISAFGHLISTPEVLLKYRLNGNSISKLNRQKQILKKNQLINNWSGWDSVYSECLLALNETKVLYSSSEGRYERILLHLKELRMVSNILGKPIPMTSLAREFSLLDLLGLSGASIRLIYWLSIRKIYRVFQK
jgi:glycosyltransferase involved in cell wall biosynthesis